MKHILDAIVWNKFRSHVPLGFYNLIKGHTGVDLNYVFEEVPSPVSGLIEDVNWEKGGPGDHSQNEMGQTIYLKDVELGNIHVFAHFKEIKVRKGQTVKKDDILGISGNTGIKSTKPHLHYEIITFKKPDKIKPSFYDKLFSPIMSRSLNGYSGWNINPIDYLLLLYAKYHILK